MTEAELLERVRELRERGRSPKEIARGLRVPSSRVEPLVRALAAERPIAAPSLAGCWVSPGWTKGLGVAGHPDWPGAAGGHPTDAHPEGSGLVSVLVAWEQRYGATSCCAYLVDTWCLGVKDVVGPRTLKAAKLPAFRDSCFAAYDAHPLSAPIDLAQHLVWGAVDYARSLGFEPHPDFAAAADHLDRPDGPCPITFGNDGTPCYVEGPHDDADRVVRTLERSVSDGNFHFTVALR